MGMYKLALMNARHVLEHIVAYLLNKFGDPDFFVWFYFKYIINSMPGEFQHILISGTITAELP
jgi:hypothetical protein